MKVSLVIPLRNEEESLPRLLHTIQQQALKPEEIVLVDGGSTDNTLELARRAAESDSNIHVIEAGPATPGRGRNVGIEAAANEWVALTDAGNRLDSNWLKHLVAQVDADPSADVVYGNFEPVIDSWFTRCAALAYLPPMEMHEGGMMRGPSIVSALLRRDVWRKLGGFPDLRAAEDLVFMSGIQESGFKIKWAPQATVWWEMQPNLALTFRRFTLYSMHNVLAGRQWDWHYGVARQYVLAIAFVLLAVLHSPWWLTGFGVWLGARIIRSIWRRREKRSLWWALNPLQFVTVGVIILTIDLATFVGWARALRMKQPKLD